MLILKKNVIVLSVFLRKNFIKANALADAIKKWDGKTPTMITGEATNMLMQLK
jgi:hypothetical protein